MTPNTSDTILLSISRHTLIIWDFQGYTSSIRSVSWGQNAGDGSMGATTAVGDQNGRDGSGLLQQKDAKWDHQPLLWWSMIYSHAVTHLFFSCFFSIFPYFPGEMQILVVGKLPIFPASLQVQFDFWELAARRAEQLWPEPLICREQLALIAGLENSHCNVSIHWHTLANNATAMHRVSWRCGYNGMYY